MASQKRVKMKRNSPNKELLLSWLRTALDFELYPGLGWSDKENKKFYVKWVHKSSEQWSGDDLEPFKAWAGHKGKLDGKNPKQLKATFRCALNSKKELKECGRDKERRYWRFVDPNSAEKDTTPKKRRKNNKVSRLCEDSAVTVACNSDVKSTSSNGSFSLRMKSESEDEMSRSAKLPPFDSVSNFEPLTPPDQANENSYTFPDFKFSKAKINKLEKCCSNSTDMDHSPANISFLNATSNLLENTYEEYRTNYTPPPDRSRLTPSQKSYHISRDISHQLPTDVWQPNCWPLYHTDKEPKGLSDFFSSDFIGMYKTSNQEPENNNSMDFLDMDQYVPVVNTSTNHQLHSRNGLTTLINRTPSNNPTQPDHLLERLDDLFLSADVDPEECRKLMQEIDRPSSALHYRLHS